MSLVELPPPKAGGISPGSIDPSRVVGVVLKPNDEIAANEPCCVQLILRHYGSLHHLLASFDTAAEATTYAKAVTAKLNLALQADDEATGSSLARADGTLVDPYKLRDELAAAAAPWTFAETDALIERAKP